MFLKGRAISGGGGEYSASSPGRALPLGTHRIEGWVDLRADLEAEARGIYPVVQSVVRHYTN
jgi:hypothetical protein